MFQRFTKVTVEYPSSLLSRYYVFITHAVIYAR
jgi:hypothetical protein